MARQTLIWLWLLALGLTGSAYSARVMFLPDFACANQVVLSGVVISVDQLAPVKGDPWPDGMVPYATDCRAEVAILSILKDATGALVDGETVSVRYPCGSLVVLQGLGKFVEVDAGGNSLFVSILSVPVGSDGYHLSAQETFLFGLRSDSSGFSPGAGGFTWSAEDSAAVRNALEEHCGPSN